MTRLGMFDWIALVLLLIGGLNWGLVGVFEWNLVDAIFGEMSGLSRVIYTLVGIAAIYLALYSPKFRREA